MPTPPSIPFLWRFAYRVAYLMLRVARVFGLRPPGAFVAIWSGPGVLLVKTSYQPYYTLPGGMVHHGEDARTNALREVAEEVGIALAPDSVRRVVDSPQQARLDRDGVALFEVQVAEPPAVRLDKREIEWAGYVSPDDPRVEQMWPAFRAYVQASRYTRSR